MTLGAGFSFGNFRPILDPEMAGKLQSVRRKKLIFSDVEARELSYPILTFLGTFWNLQNLEISVPGAPIFRILRSGALVRQGRKSEIFECVGIDPNRSESI